MHDFEQFWHDKLRDFCHIRARQFNWIQASVANNFKGITALYSHCKLSNIDYLLSLLQKILNNLHFNFRSVENSNCTYHYVKNITKYIPYCGNYQHKILLTI